MLHLDPDPSSAQNSTTNLRGLVKVTTSIWNVNDSVHSAQDDVASFLNAVFDGWRPKQGGSEAKEIYGCMSWVARGNAVKLIQKIADQKDWPLV